MIRRGTLIILGIFIVLIGATWYLEWSPTGQARVRGTPTVTPYPQVLVLDINNLTKIELKSSQGSLVGISRNLNGTWTFTDAQNTPADQGKVQQLLSSILGLQSLSTMDSTVSLDNFGLVTANQIITFQTSNGSKVLKIGNVTPTDGYYIQVDSNTPIVVSKSAVDDVLNLFTQSALSVATPTPLPSAPAPNG
jgi:hypothetical protein